MSDVRSELQGISDQLGSELQALADYLKEQAAERFTKHGGLDPRGAALWDVAAHIEETVIPRINREEGR